MSNRPHHLVGSSCVLILALAACDPRPVDMCEAIPGTYDVEYALESSGCAAAPRPAGMTAVPKGLACDDYYSDIMSDDPSSGCRTVDSMTSHVGGEGLWGKEVITVTCPAKPPCVVVWLSKYTVRP
jgi:hypothetical protein